MGKNNAQPITDLGNPRYPIGFRAINFFGRPLASRLASLEEQNLLDTARKRTGLNDFGDESFRERLQLLLTAINREANLHFAGQYMVRQLIVGLLSTRLILHDMLKQHPEILEEEIKSPIIIAGLPRTGTTHLHNLMSQDPSFRFLPYWESLEPFLPPHKKLKPGERNPRIKRCEQGIKMLEYVMPLFPAMHEMTADGPHEEIQLLAIDFGTMLFETAYHVPSFRDWYKSHDHMGSYLYMKTVLQALQWKDGSRKRWLLKSPQHLEQIGPLLVAFPDAKIVQTHRDPVRITASMVTMVTYGHRMNARKVDPFTIGRNWAARTEDLLRASVEDRHLIPEGQAMDVRFHEYMADQMGILEKVYEFVEHPLTDEAVQAIQSFIEANPKGKHGAVQYRLDLVGINPNERREALRFYQERFDIPDE
ncbi:MAG: sulfotransferase [Chloroflexi bacterium]|nr:sulfotransferase [Chloroflexota bacterium]